MSELDGKCLVCGAVQIDGGKCCDPDCYVHDRARIADLERRLAAAEARLDDIPIVAESQEARAEVGRLLASGLDMEGAYHMAQREVERLTEECHSLRFERDAARYRLKPDPPLVIDLGPAFRGPFEPPIADPDPEC